MKSENGVTLMLLIVTVIILIILIATVVQTGSLSVSENKLRSFSYELQQIQGAVDTTHQKMILDPNTDYVTLNEKQLGANIIAYGKAMDVVREFEYLDYRTADTDDPNYYSAPGVSLYRYFSVAELDKTLNVKNASGPVVINFKTKTVISVEGLTVGKKEATNGKKTYHRLNEIIKK